VNRFALYFAAFVGSASALALVLVAGISFACQSGRAGIDTDKGSEMRITPASRPQDGLSQAVNTPGGKPVDLRRATREVAAGSPGFAHSSSVSMGESGLSLPAHLRSTMEREPRASEHGVRHVPGRAVTNEVGLLRDARGHSNLYEVTAYSHGCILPRDGRPEGHARRAANGRWPVADVTVAADTSLHPFGTEVLVEGVGFRTVGDRGHAIKGRKLDLFVDTCAEARRFGRRWLVVHAVPSETTREGSAN